MIYFSVYSYRWFDGLIDAYDNRTIADNQVIQKTIKKNETLSDNNRDFMVKLLSEEYQFYKFIKKRFSFILHKAEQVLPQRLTNKSIHILELQQTASHRLKTPSET